VGGPEGPSSQEPAATNKSAAVASTNDDTTIDEAVDPKEVSLSWKEKMGGSAKSANDTLVAELSNNTNAPQTGRLLLVGLGLDGRIVTRPMGTYSLAANAKSTVTVPVSALPVQSEAAASFSVLQVEYDRMQGPIRSQTRPLYYIFSGGYAKVELYSSEELRKLPNGGLRTNDPMDVRGRVWNSATSTMAAIDTKATATAGDAQQGLTVPVGVKPGQIRTLERGKSPNSPAASALTPMIAPLVATSSVRVCLYWDVWYNDSGFGEDVWPWQGYAWVPASYVYAVVGDSTTRYFEGNVDKSGCTQYFQVPASSTVSAIWWTDWQIDWARGIQFDNWSSVNGLYDPYGATDGNYQPSAVSISFYTPGPGQQSSKNLRPIYNDDVIQVAAVTGLMLKTNDDRVAAGLDPLTTVTNSYQQIMANLGCSDARPDTACPGLIGPQSGGNGEPGAWWKFLIAHELGHSFGQRMDVSNVHEPGEFDTLPYCRCDQVINGPEHCLQMLHGSGPASLEGAAHYFSTKIWNNDSQANAKFVYYKKFQNVDGTITYPPYGYEGFNPVKWMENHCSGGPNWTGMGTEWDWLTFRYNIASRDRTNRTMSTDVNGIMNRACLGYPGCDSNWSLPPGQYDGYTESIVDAARNWYGGSYGDPRYQRFQQAGVNHGIAHN